MNALLFQIRLLQPLLIGQVAAGEENSETSLNYIPGSVIRGALIQRYLQQQGLSEDQAMDDACCRQLFFGNSVAFLHAYPLHAHGKRMLPTPSAWRVAKDERNRDDAKIYDFAVEENKTLTDGKQPSGEFCLLRKDTVELGSPQRQINLHNASEDRQMKQAGNSMVFRYDAIAAGESFCAVILATDAALLREKVQPLLQPMQMHIGGSRSAGYGRVELMQPELIVNWPEYEPDENDDEEVTILTFLSDAILRDATGQPTVNLPVVLGRTPMHAFQHIDVVAGFNRKWGLPLPQLPVIKAGSVYAFAPQDLDADTCAQLVREGIGERRNEGFGRVAINWNLAPKLQRRPLAKPSFLESVTLSAESQTLAQRIVNHPYRAKLDMQLLDKVSQLTLTPTPQNTQLARLRTVGRRAQREKSLLVIANHIKNLTKTTSQQFKAAKIDGQALDEWLSKGVQNNKFWHDYFAIVSAPFSLGNITASATDDLQLKYTMRLIDEVMKKASKTEDQGGKK